MKIKEMLEFMDPTESVRVYTDCEVPDFEGFADDVPWRLAEYEISKNSVIGIEDGKYIAMNAEVE